MIRVEGRGAVRVVTLDRADKRNALTVAMLGDLKRAFEDLGPASAEPVRAVVLLGAGPVFCAGFDLNEDIARDADPLAALRLQLTGLAEAVAAMRAGGAAVVAGVQGAAVAGGCALLGGADMVVAERGARLGYPVLRLGISPAVTGPWLAAMVGDGAARALMLEPELIGAERALAVGLVHEVVDGAGVVEARAMEVAAMLAGKPGGAVAATRGWLDEIGRGEIARSMERAGPGEALAASLAAVDGETERRMREKVWKR